MDFSFLVKLLFGFIKDNLPSLKIQFHTWLKEKAGETESEIDDELVAFVAALLGIPE